MARPKSWKRVKTINVPWSAENGAIEFAPQTLWLDPTGEASFAMELPEYVCKAMKIDPVVNCAKAEDVKPRVERIMRDYSEWAKNARAEPVILISAKYFGETEDGRQIKRQSFFIDSEMGHDRADTTRAVGLQYWLAFRVNGNIHAREVERGYDDERNRDESKDVVTVGWNKGKVSEQGAIVLGYTPALHARIDAIMKAINNAAININEILEAKDVAAALLSGAGAKLLSDQNNAVDSTGQKRG